MSIKEDLINTLAENLTYEDIVRAEEYSEGYAEGFKDGLEAGRLQEWIPCSEKLPKEYGKYLVTAKIFDNIVTEINVFDDEEQRWCWVGKVLAWKPLPQAWKGADDE